MLKNKKENKFDPRCHIGEVHGIYAITEVLNEKDKYGHWIYIGECTECGYKHYSHYGDFVKNVSMCRHLSLGMDEYVSPTKWDNYRIGHIFRGMKQRCYSKQNKNYKWYGGKGIGICEEWLNNPKFFEEWSVQNGYDDNLTIDRIDESKDYSPNNCRWIACDENTRRAGKVNWITVNGITLSGKQWAQKLGVGINRINALIRKQGIDAAKEFIMANINNH